MPASSVRSRASGRITLADVAKLAEVSSMTASRVLRGERSVDAELVARVQTAVQQLGYMPDPAARALASQRSSHVAVLIPLLSNALFVDLLEAVQRTLRPANYQTLIGITHYDAREEEQLLREQLLHRPAGILLTGTERSEGAQLLLAQCGIPCVHLMELIAAPTTIKAHRPVVYSVGLSQQDAGATMTRHLLARGKRRIAFAAAQLDPRTLLRRDGWASALQEAGLYDPHLEWLDSAPSSLALGGTMLAKIMAHTPEVDAVFFCNDDLAQGALLAAMGTGWRVPEQIAIAGFNDLTGSDQMCPPLTTIRTPRAEIGQAAAEMLLKLMLGTPVTTPCVDVGYELIVRGST